MEPIGIASAVITGGMVVILIGLLSRKRSSRFRFDLAAAPPPPERLGVRAGSPAVDAALRLEAALDADYVQRIKERVMREQPTLKEREWEWLWFELKRFFLLTAVLRQVNMYSERVDRVWHEMLMFTRDYQLFCERFCGTMIHHSPHRSGAAVVPGERAWFDWTYNELFEPTPVAHYLWGDFYRKPLPLDQIQALEIRDGAELRRNYFNAGAAAYAPYLDTVIDYLITRVKVQIAHIRSLRRNKVRRPSREQLDPGGLGLASCSLLYGSMMWTGGDFDREMHDLCGPNRGSEQQACNDASSSGCGSTVFCGSSSPGGGSSGDGGSGGSDGGGSSCSSGCGGGCSS